MNISLGRGQNQVQIEPENQQNIQKISAGVNKLLLQNVKLGDLLTGEIIDSLQKQIKLLLPDGTVFEAKLDQSLDLYIGQEVTLEVKDIIGKQIHMEMAVEANPQQEDTSSDIINILKQLDLPMTEDSEQAVKLLMQKMLPITKDNIKQIEFGLKTSQLPIDSILAMLENEIPITPKTLSQIQAYENGEIKLQGQLEGMIGEILDSDHLEFLDQVHQLLTTSKLDRAERTGQLASLKEAEILNQPETIGQSEVLKEAEVFETTLLGKESPPGSLYNRDIQTLKQEISNLFKELLFIDPSGLKNKTDTRLEKIKELYKDIYKLTDSLEKIEDLESGKEKTSLYSDIKSNIEFLTIANKYDTMIHIPIVIQNQYKHGELYIFNKKKTGKKSYHEASMLISLETTSLGTVEVYIKKYNKQISAQFKTDDEVIQKIIKNQINLLKTNLKDKGYDLGAITYLLSNQPFSVEEPEQEKKAGRYRFDTKA